MIFILIGKLMVQFLRKGIHTKYPKVSIVTPVWNAAETIMDALDSVANQTYPNIEHIVVDGVSKDISVSLAMAYAHVSQIIIGEDSGIYDAVNKGIQASNGDIVAILNADDFYMHNAVVSKMVESLILSDAQIAYANLLMVHAEKTN